MNKVTKPNLYTLTDILGAAAVIAAAGAKFNKVDVSPAVVLAFLATGVATAQVLCGKVVVSNPHRLPVWVKPEDGSKPYLTTDEVITDADGIKVYGRVYKFRNGTHVTIDADEGFTTSSLTGKFLNWLGGGELPTPPDESWQPLFDA